MSNGIKVPFCKPYYNGQEVKYAKQAIKSGWTTTGPKCKEFEEKFAAYVGANYCITVASCTQALGLAIEWHKQKRPEIKRVLVPSLTFAATVNEVVNAGLEPVFGDVFESNMTLKHEPTVNIDLAIPVHLTGNKANTNYAWPIIEDSAHLIERDQCKDNPNTVCFSFYATKNLAMGEGGAICTNDPEAAVWFRQARHHGISKGGWDRYKEGGSWLYNIEFVGWKANLSDVHAAIGLAQLEKMDKINELRQQKINLYNKLLGLNNQGLHLYPVLAKDRKHFMEVMKEKEIQCSVHFLPVHLMSAYKKYNDIKLSVTERLGEHLVSLPLFPGLKINEQKFICKTIKNHDLL